MKIGKFTILPRTRVLGIDVRPVFVWLEKFEAWLNARKRQKAILNIHDTDHNGE